MSGIQLDHGLEGLLSVQGSEELKGTGRVGHWEDVFASRE